MGAIEVNRLRLRCPTDQRERTRFALEDALRTALPDPRRLVLLRRMRIAGPGSGGHAARRQAAVHDGWLAAVADSRHGGADGADTANCVWFENRDEAEALLLAWLLAGRAATGWFWRLALPDWRGRPAADWLRHGLDEAMRQSDDTRALRLVETAIVAGATEILLAAVCGPPAPASGRADGAHVPDGSSSGGAAVGIAGASGAPPGSALRVDRALATRHATPLVLTAAETRLVALLARQGKVASGLLRIVVRALALRQSPALALAPLLLAEIIAQTIAVQTPGGAGRTSAPPAARRVDRSDLDSVADAAPASARADRMRKTNAPPSPDPPPAYHRATDDSEPFPPIAAGPVRAEPISPAQPLAGQRLVSRHAGLWLVIPSLIELGFRDWLSDHPEWLGAHPGRQLLLAIARHHRVPARDPALSLLEPELHPGALPDWTNDWRRALDGWLRRRARRRLHDLIRRPGTIELGDRRLDILFPAAAADIRLRRRALDRDPGWTDWLGLSIRYHFGDISEGFSL
jgi:hypothetical protein